MRTVFVSLICDLYKHRDFRQFGPTDKWSEAWLAIDFRLRNLRKLIDSGIPLILFAEENIIPIDWHIPATVRIVPFSLNDITTYNAVLAANPILPSAINTPKDTLQYFALMNSKLEFIDKARSIDPSAEIYCWIDCGIFKFIKDVPAAYAKLDNYQHLSFDTHFLSPSGMLPAWKSGTYITDHVYWRFLGSMFFVKSQLFAEFKNSSDQMLSQTLNQNKITWEVNVWAVLESFCPYMFSTYVADHDDSILDINIERTNNAT